MLAKIGSQTINLGLVARYFEPAGSEDRIELTLITGAVIALEGAEADALRRYLALNAVDLLAADPTLGGEVRGNFSAPSDQGSLLPHPNRAEQNG